MLLSDWFKAYNYTPSVLSAAAAERKNFDEREREKHKHNTVNTQHTDCRPTKDQINKAYCVCVMIKRTLRLCYFSPSTFFHIMPPFLHSYFHAKPFLLP